MASDAPLPWDGFSHTRNYTHFYDVNIPEITKSGWAGATLRTVWSLRSVRTACRTRTFPTIVSRHAATSTTPRQIFLNSSLNSLLPSVDVQQSSNELFCDWLAAHGASLDWLLRRLMISVPGTSTSTGATTSQQQRQFDQLSAAEHRHATGWSTTTQRG